ncbi:hypothetical protein SAMN04487939_10618 [Lysobacter sp. yr284]|uniref:hypothetical protein n=1 Tax=Lysobacter sp. yr284 TaxID=1761791 RepID=UPI00089ABCD4|nr:hypothetical protein [Lysobacter sp. yr284]SDY77538.1 hypothetical protein SAMN04487939_10618 [Lysobacter sp. yr284]
MKHLAHIAVLALLAVAAPGHAAQGRSDSKDRKADAADSSASAPAAGSDRLVPNEASGDDCAADARIGVVPDEPMRRLHVRLCEARVQPAYRARCGESARELGSIPFVTDHCGSLDEPVEVALGGRSYRLRRIGAEPAAGAPRLAGTFAGDGLRMQVKPAGAVRERLDEGEAIGIEQEVTVSLSLDGAKRTLPAVYSDGP